MNPIRPISTGLPLTFISSAFVPTQGMPAQHPELAVVCWSLALLVIFAPLAVRLYGNKVR
jgi:hypothetical protein